MKKDILNQIKETIKDLKGNKTMVNAQIKQLEISYKQQVAEYDPSNWFDNSTIERLKKDMNNSIYNLIQSYGCDASLHIIYLDGSETCADGGEIVMGDCNPKLSNIVYAHYSDGDMNVDTETGELVYDVSEDDQRDAYEAYMDSIEIKYNTVYGLRQKAM